jgi:hypothetical protein
MRLTPATAKRYLTDDALSDLARKRMVSFADEAPSADLLAAARSVALPLNVPGRCVAGLSEALPPVGEPRPPRAREAPGRSRRYDARMATASSDRVTVIVYSNLAEVRAQVRTAVGRRPAPDIPRIDWIECATSAQVVEQIDLGDVDLAILDGEAQPTGGMGLARQFKYEIDDCPPIVILVARKDDGWLANWSLADGVITQPLDPVTAAEVVADQLRKRISGIP